MATATESTLTGILARLVESADDSMSSEVAEYLLRLKFKPADLKRMDELAEKSNDGTITDAEREALENYVRARHFLPNCSPRHASL